MLGEQLQFLARFYTNPRKAASAVLDRGRILFGAVAALLVALAIHIPTTALQHAEIGQTLSIQVSTRPVTADAIEQYRAAYAQALRDAGRRYFASGFRSLLILTVVFVPFCVLLLAVWDRLGSGTTILFRDYMPTLAGLLFAWTAAHLPVAAVWWFYFLPSGPGSSAVVPLQWAGIGLFLYLAAPVLSTVTGAALSHSAVTAALGLAVGGGALFLFSGFTHFPFLFFSPWILFLLYRRFAGDMGELGGGLASRQNFKRQLEVATLNPSDADARYQLGLLYLQRRLPAEAEESFRRALAIDPDEPDALFQLGRLLRLQGGRNDEARQLLAHAARLNPKLSSCEVWRELGAVELAAGRIPEALLHLDRYIAVREYDPEGLVHHGRALRAAERPAEARAAFQQAIDSARGAPKFRRGEVARWENQARQELKTLPPAG